MRVICLPTKDRHTTDMNEKILTELRDELNRQTAQMPWTELERWFASGGVIRVANELDLIDVAARIAADDKPSIQQWMAAGLIGKVMDNQAAVWLSQNSVLWTVVVKPWILVQQEKILPTGKLV